MAIYDPVHASYGISKGALLALTGMLALEIDAFLTTEALVTFRSAPIAEVDRVWDRCAREPELLGRELPQATSLGFGP